MRRVAVALDHSVGSQHALRWAYEEARRRHATLTAVTAWLAGEGERVAPGLPADWLARATTTVEIDEVLGAEGRHVRVWVPARPAPAAAVLRWVSRRVDLLVLGQDVDADTTPSAAEPVGAGTRRVLVDAACPVVTVRDAPAARWGRITVGDDGSAGGAAALSWAVAEAHAAAAEVDLLRAWEWPPQSGAPLRSGLDETSTQRRAARSLQRAVDALPDAARAIVHPVLVRGSARLALIAAAATSDLVVVGRRGLADRNGALGSVTEALVHRCVAPVAVVPEVAATRLRAGGWDAGPRLAAPDPPVATASAAH